MTKPSLTFTLDRQLQTEGQEPIRLAVTLNAWTSREQADVDENNVKTALAKASAQISADVFGDQLPQVKESCGDCRFFRPLYIEDGYGLPSACLRRSPRESRDWPNVNTDDWCGDFARGVRPTP